MNTGDIFVLVGMILISFVVTYIIGLLNNYKNFEPDEENRFYHKVLILKLKASIVGGILFEVILGYVLLDSLVG